MRIFGRSKITKASATARRRFRRTEVTGAASVMRVTEAAAA